MKIVFALAIFGLACSALAEPAPVEFITQVLEPTGGKIERPEEWFYHESHHGPVYDWILSREDTSGGGRYITGVRIQVFVGVMGGTGKSAEQFMRDFIAGKKKTADKIVKACEPTGQGIFTRACLETEEGGDHILYSVFWGVDKLDVAVVSIAGTTKELWTTYAATFDKMSHFELIDMKRFDK